MRKRFLVALALLLPAVANAQAQPAGKPAESPAAQGEEKSDQFSGPGRMSSEDMTAYAEARIAALKAGLQLKAEQEKNWGPLESALRDAAKARVEKMEDWRDNGAATFDTDPLGALQRRARHMSARAAAFDKIAAAGKPLYDSLDEAQKRRFGHLLKAAIRGGHGRGEGMGSGMGAGMGGGMHRHHHHHMRGRH